MNIIDSIPVKTVSDTAFVYIDPIDLSRDRYQGKNILIQCDVTGGQSTAQFDVNALWSRSAITNFSALVTGSGSSKIITSGTTGAVFANSYLSTLTNVLHSGITIPFEATGFLKLGTKSTNCDFDLTLSVIV